MRRHSIVHSYMLLLIGACVLTAVLSVVIYAYTGANFYAKRIAEEMVPRVHGIARMAERMQTGQVSPDAFEEISMRNIRDNASYIYVFSSEGELVTNSESVRSAGETVSDEVREIALRAVEEDREQISADWRSPNGLVVAVPVHDNLRRVIGVVAVGKPAREVQEALGTLMASMAVSTLIVSALMIGIGYLSSRTVTRPIQNMTRAAAAMEEGDFSVRADESQKNEIGQLGSALNSMSSRLAENIRELTDARDRLSTILEGLAEGVIYLDAEGELAYGNQAAYALFGAGDPGMLSERIRPCREMARDALQSGEQRQDIYPSGEKTLQVTCSRASGHADRSQGTVLLVRDITAAQRLEQTRRDYVANVSHELRTPIASIRSLAETLNDGLVSSEDDRNRYYGYILRESMRMTRLINDLLELSRLQSGGVALEKLPFDLTALLREVTERTSVIASYSGIGLCLEPVEDGLWVNSNRDRIEQVLVALLDNAIKYSPDEGTVRVQAETSGNRILVSVFNTGRIDEKDLPHLFERFYKADASHHGGGTGLGLAIVREVLVQLGEKIWAENDGNETVFRFTLDRTESPS